MHVLGRPRFNKELLIFEYKDGREHVRGVLRWPRTLAAAVAIRVGFARRDSVRKKIEILCFEVTDEEGYVDVCCANPLGPKYAAFMWPAPAEDIVKLGEHYSGDWMAIGCSTTLCDRTSPPTRCRRSH